MRHRADFALQCEDAAVALAAAKALEPELSDGPPGTTASARADGARLHLVLEAEDASGLRAAMQGLVRLADAAVRVAEGRP